MRFRNRKVAGQQLAQRLQSYHNGNTVVLALPRGGVPVGFEIAQALQVPFYVLPVRKLGVPQQPELAFGAVGAQGQVVLNAEVVQQFHIAPETMEAAIQAESAEIERRLHDWRIPPLSARHVKHRTCIVVDDGLATGATALAAIRTLEAMNPEQIVMAAPVCSLDAAHRVGLAVDDLVCLQQPSPFNAVGEWYEDFHQTTDTEVKALLAQSTLVS